jgi:Pyruvate/2-oxoacid:ferredoxin oxidoreductase delta subunit
MEGDGPASSGKLRDLNLILCSSDCVALDSVMALIMGVEPERILSSKEAYKRGLGELDTKNITILGERLEDVIGKPFILPSTTLTRIIPQPLLNLARKLIKYYPYVEYSKCVKCQACKDACPGDAINFENNSITFNYSRCLSCFCCQEACPASAVKVKKSILAKLIGL